MRILSNIREICSEGITSFKIYKPSSFPKMDVTQIRELDYELRKNAGYSYLWVKGKFNFVKIYDPSSLSKLASALKLKKSEIAKSSLKIVNEMWDVDVPRLCYCAIRESAVNHSPGSVRLGRNNRRIMFPQVSFESEDESIVHGILMAIHRVDESGIAFSADYISRNINDKTDKFSTPRLSPNERWNRTEAILEQMIPKGGLPICIGGNHLKISSKSVVWKLKGE